MTWSRGQSGNALGRAIEKPFADALRLQIAAAGSNHAKLREIAANLLRIASITEGATALPAIMAIADRLDGKPSQESVVSVVKRDASDWTRDELVAFLHNAATLQQAELKTIEARPNETEDNS